MLSTVRERLSNTPPAVSYAICTILILGAGVIVFLELKPVPLEKGPPPDPNAYFKCTNPECGYVLRGRLEVLISAGQVTIDWMKDPRGRGARCPKCKRDALQLARKCRHCGEVFTANRDYCPACRKSPFDE